MFSFGFYNSKDHDRKYNASHFGKMFDGIIQDGVFGAAPQPLNSMFNVEPKNDPNLQVTLNPGKAWLMHTWNILDSKTTITFNAAQANYKRTDAIVIEVNNNYSDLEGSLPRTNAIKIVEGSPVLISNAQNVPPALTQVWNANQTERRLWQYPIAYITVYGSNYDGGTVDTQFEKDKIKSNNIEMRINPVSRVESEEYQTWLPLVTGATMNESIDAYFPVSTWESQFNAMLNQDTIDFNDWFDTIKGQLGTDVATRLQAELDAKIQYGYDAAPQTLEPGQVYFQIED